VFVITAGGRGDSAKSAMTDAATQQATRRHRLVDGQPVAIRIAALTDDPNIK